jgi:hypothetical protein
MACPRRRLWDHQASTEGVIELIPDTYPRKASRRMKEDAVSMLSGLGYSNNCIGHKK